jgi:hypothetical protein
MQGKRASWLIGIGDLLKTYSPQYPSGEQKANTIFAPCSPPAVFGSFCRRASFSKELNYPRARWTEVGITRKIQKCLSEQFLSDLL